MLRFLLRLAEYCDTPQLYGCTLASDNSSLIARIKDLGTVLYPAPSLSLAPDWNIINEIEIACKQLQIQHPPTIQHVKGHQDREKQYHELDLISQLNVTADSAAGKFQENFSAQEAPSCTVSPTMAPSFISRTALSTSNTSNRSGMQIQPQHCWNI
jgi:hypothetical protein